jgi:excisionase family DNA binding protein
MTVPRLTLRVEEAAGLLGISRALAYELVNRGELPALRLGRRIVVPRAALEALVASADAGIGAAPAADGSIDQSAGARERPPLRPGSSLRTPHKRPVHQELERRGGGPR